VADSTNTNLSKITELADKTDQPMNSVFSPEVHSSSRANLNQTSTKHCGESKGTRLILQFQKRKLSVKEVAK
jgi:hypothetical protein